MRLDDDRYFSDAKRSQAAAGAQPSNCLSNFYGPLGCKPGLGILNSGARRFEGFVHGLCTQWLADTNCLERDSSRSRQGQHRISHHKKNSWRDHAPSSRLQDSHKTAKCLSLLQRANFLYQHIKLWFGHEITQRQTTTFDKASVNIFACPEAASAASANKDVDVLLYPPTNTWLTTLAPWLDPNR